MDGTRPPETSADPEHRRSELSVRTLWDSLPDGVIAFDREGSCSYFNPEAGRILGWDLSATHFRLSTRSGCAVFGSPEVQRAISQRVSLDLEVHQPVRDCWIECRVRPIPEGGALLCLRDVSRRKQVEREARQEQRDLRDGFDNAQEVITALRASEQRFSSFMENLPGLAWMKDLEGRYFYVNAAAAEAFGTPPETLYGRTDEELFPPDTAAQFRRHDQRALSEGGGILVVETLSQPDGVLHHSLVSKFPVLDPEGKTTGIGGMAVDITERIRAEEALRLADRRKDEFLAMLAHELRNPLSPMVTAVEVIRLRAVDDPPLERQRQVIHRQLTQMKRLLDDLLDVSRITRGKIVLRQEQVDLREVVAQAVETSRPHFETRGHVLHVSGPELPAIVLGDPARLCQIFINLLNNAAVYTPPGGRVWLATEQRERTIRISVKDTGIGMTPELLAHAFEPFIQGERTLERAPGGLGLGLALVRELAERQGGTVTGQSAGPDLGSEFTVTLPLLADDSLR